MKSFEDGKDYTVYISGGGMHNPILMENIQSQMTGVEFRTTLDLNIHPDAKEAVLFALLANECICGGPATDENKSDNYQMGEGRNGIPNVTMGKISFPD